MSKADKKQPYLADLVRRNVKRVATDRSVKLTEVAQRLDPPMAINAFSNQLNSRTGLRATTLKQIADILHVSMDEFFRET